MISVRIQNRSRSNEQRLPPIWEVRNVGRKAHDALLNSVHGMQANRFMRRLYFEFCTSRDCSLKQLLDRRHTRRQTNLQFRVRLSGQNVRSRAAGKNPDVAGRIAEDFAGGPVALPNTLKYIQQSIDS